MSELDPRGALRYLLRHRFFLFGTCLVFAALMAVLTLMDERSYESRMILMPESRRTIGGLNGVAAQLGLSLPGSDGSPGLGFYADLVQARGTLDRVAAETLAVPRENGVPERLQVEVILKIRGDTPRIRRETAVKTLQKMISAIPSQRSGTLTLLVSATSAEVARGIAQSVFRILNEQSIAARQTQASAERKFAESRVTQARSELREAEDDLQRFLEANREYQRAPALQFAYDRQTRRVTLLQQVLSTLTQAYEQARLDEVRDVPQIMMIDPPTSPVFPQSRHVLLKTGLAGIGGLILAIFALMARDAVVAYRTSEHAVP